MNYYDIRTHNQLFEHSQQYIKLNCETIDNEFLFYNESLEIIDLPNVETIGTEFLSWNKSLNKIDLPKVKSIGDWEDISLNSYLQ